MLVVGPTETISHLSPFLRTIGPRVENGFAVQVIRNRALQFDQAAVANVTAGHQRTGQVNDIANANVCQIFGFDPGL